MKELDDALAVLVRLRADDFALAETLDGLDDSELDELVPVLRQLIEVTLAARFRRYVTT